MTALKLMALWQTDDQEMEMLVIPPCAGYYTNLRMQMMQVTGGVSDEDPYFFYAGTALSKEIRDEISIADKINVNPDLDKKGVHTFFNMNQKDVDGAIQYVVTKHWKNKRIYVDQDDLLRVFTKSQADGSDIEHWVLTGDFVPLKGSFFSMEVQIFTMLVSNNWFNSPVTIPVTIENAVVELVAQGPALNTSTTQGFVKIMKFPKDFEIESHTFANVAVGDILQNVHTVALARRTMDKNVILNVDFSFVVGGSNMAKGKKAIKLLTQGQVLGTDIIVTDGSTADIDVTIRISGFVKYQDDSNDANFLGGPGIQNLNVTQEGLI